MDQELQAITEIGRRRSRVRTVAFCIAWPGLFILFFLALGIFVNAILTFILAASIAQGVMQARTKTITQDVCAGLGISPNELRVDQYLIS